MWRHSTRPVVLSWLALTTLGEALRAQSPLTSLAGPGDPDPFAHNRTGFVPQFRGNAVSLWEIAYTPGKKASSVRAFVNVESRMGYSGLYRFGVAYNPAHFSQPGGTSGRDGSVLMYWMATQALWRTDTAAARGLDATISYDWSPRSVNRNYSQLTAGLRFNEPLPVPFHNTMAIGFVDNVLLSPVVRRRRSLGASPTESGDARKGNVMWVPA